MFSNYRLTYYTLYHGNPKMESKVFFIMVWGLPLVLFQNCSHFMNQTLTGPLNFINNTGYIRNAICTRIRAYCCLLDQSHFWYVHNRPPNRGGSRFWILIFTFLVGERGVGVCPPPWYGPENKKNKPTAQFLSLLSADYTFYRYGSVGAY